MAETIFYSWQSDRAGRVCRSFVEEALKRAIKDLCRTFDVEEDPRLDKDTQGLPGSPDIVASIEHKIDRAQAFIGDVTLVTPTLPNAGRLSPNPNVATEVGYALRSLGEQRVLLVMNESFGGRSDLPFDLRNRRVIAYSFADTPDQTPDDKWRTERNAVRDQLAQELSRALKSIFEGAAPPPPTLAQQLRSIPRQFRKMCGIVVGTSPPEYKVWREVERSDGTWFAIDGRPPDDELRDTVISATWSAPDREGRYPF